MTPRIIAISGKIGSGKDTLARKIAENLDDQVYCIHFATPVKKYLEEISGVRMVCQEYGPFVNPVLDFAREDKDKYLEMYDVTVGEFLQLFAEDMRQGEPMMFVNAAEIKIAKALDKGYVVIIPDLRHLNEAEMIKENDGIIIRLEGSHDDSRDPNHVSEVQLDDYDGFSYTTTLQEGKEESIAMKIISMFGL